MGGAHAGLEAGIDGVERMHDADQPAGAGVEDGTSAVFDHLPGEVSADLVDGAAITVQAALAVCGRQLEAGAAAVATPFDASNWAHPPDLPRTHRRSDERWIEA